MEYKNKKNNKEGITVVNTVNSEEVKNSLLNYNENIYNYNEAYDRIIPLETNVLVRAYKTMEKAYYYEMSPTSTNQMTATRVANPHPYSNKAIIIAGGKDELAYGEVVYLDAKALASYGNYAVEKKLEYGFELENEKEEGFLLIPSYFIKAKIK